MHYQAPTVSKFQIPNSILMWEAPLGGDPPERLEGTKEWAGP